MPPVFPPDPPADCDLCPRLHQFRVDTAKTHPDWYNGAVGSFGDPDAKLLILGLAPGLRGANRTGRPFTGDFAGDLLYQTLGDFGFATGTYEADPDDGLELVDAMITNAVRCVPPQNKPIGAEINTCRDFLRSRLDTLDNLKAIVVLGRIAHESLLRTFGLKLKDHPFVHQARHDLDNGLSMFDSYHCSRYNTNTGRLTEEMFRAVFADVRRYIDG